MDLSKALSADLKNLLRVLDLSEQEIERSLLALRFEVQLAVPSFVGLTLTLVIGGQRVTLTSVDEADGLPPIASSLGLPVRLTAAEVRGSELILYATAPGAFIDLAADLSYARPSDGSGSRLDQDLTPVSRRSGLTGVAELSMINRALGVLVAQGHSPEQARAQLEGRATESRVKVFQVAAHLISRME